MRLPALACRIAWAADISMAGTGADYALAVSRAVWRLRCLSSSRPGPVRRTRGSLEFAEPICTQPVFKHRSTASLTGLGWPGCRFSFGASSIAN